MKKSWLYILVLPLLVACEREVEITLPPYTPKIVVNCLFTNSGKLVASVSGSVAALERVNPKPIENASVVLQENGITVDTLVYDFFEKKYFSDITPDYGKRYRLQVTAPGYTGVFSENALPAQVQFIVTEFKDSTGIDSVGLPTGTLRFVFQDPGGEKNSYKIRFLYYKSISNEFLPFEYTTNDASLLSPDAEEAGDRSVLFNDLLFNGQQKEIAIFTPALLATGSPRFLVEFSALSNDYEKYYLTLQRHIEASDNPFSEPVIIYTNITNGLGIFAGSIERKDTIY